MQPIFSTTPRALTNRATVVPYTQCCPPPSQKSQGSSGLSGSPSDRHSRPQAQTFLHIHGQALKAPSQPPAPQEEKAEEQSAITTWCSRSQNIPPHHGRAGPDPSRTPVPEPFMAETSL